MNALSKLNPFRNGTQVEKPATKEWFAEAVVKHPFTPDINRLLHLESWWVFVYDECQTGMPNHKFIAEDSRTYGEGMTNDTFTLWKRPLGQLSYPIALDFHEKIKEVPQAFIKGKLVNMSTSKLIELDSYKENTVQFLRRRVNLNFFYREVCVVKDPTKYTTLSPMVETQGVSQVTIPHLQTVRAWMYVGVPDFWLKLTTKGKQTIHSGWTKETSLAHLKYQDGSLIKPTTRYKPNNLKNTNEYYYFNVTELGRRE